MSENQVFNPESLLGTTIDESNSTEFILVPEGDYIAVSEPITSESFKEFDIKKGENAGKKGLNLYVSWAINDDSGQLKELLGRPPKARQSIMLDRRVDNSIEMGKGRNVGLGRLREALGQNHSGRPWSFSMLGGQVARIKVKHRMDGEKTYVEVAEVTRV